MKKTPRKPFQIKADFNLLIDEVMPELSPTAWKVLCLIIRKTHGFGKDQDEISYSQIRKGAGIKSDVTISKALHELMREEPLRDWNGNISGWYRTSDQPQLIFCKQGRRAKDNKRAPNSYTLNLDFSI